MLELHPAVQALLVEQDRVERDSPREPPALLWILAFCYERAQPPVGVREELFAPFAAGFRDHLRICVKPRGLDDLFVLLPCRGVYHALHGPLRRLSGACQLLLTGSQNQLRSAAPGRLFSHNGHRVP